MVEGEIDGDLEFNDNGADSDKRLKVTATAVGTPPPGPVADVPAEYGLAQNYPNPFNPSTTIGFAVPTPGRVKIEVFDVTGRLVGLLLDDVMSEGVHAINWGATAPNGSRLPSGVYMYRMSGYPADGSRAPFSEVRKMVLLY
jgi:hypothetical protein